LELGRHECAESGDDEDEELGNAQIRARSPKSKIRGASKLGTEMLRTNSQGSVVSNEEGMASHNLKATASLTGHEEAAIEEEGATLTPPELFLPDGSIQIVDTDRTPRPHYTSDPDPDPTPRASTSPTRKN
jgi:serine/threonine-protein kinase RIM15